jgi:hypothetical protein
MDNEPTIEIANNGTKRWILNGKLHRVDGPATEYADGEKAWYLNGLYCSFDRWLTANKYISEEEKLMLKLTHG